MVESSISLTGSQHIRKLSSFSRLRTNILPEFTADVPADRRIKQIFNRISAKFEEEATLEPGTSPGEEVISTSGFSPAGWMDADTDNDVLLLRTFTLVVKVLAQIAANS